jgi:hypothetical protein
MGTYVYGDNYLWRNYKKMKLRDFRTGKYIGREEVEKRIGGPVAQVYEIGRRRRVALLPSEEFLLERGVRIEEVVCSNQEKR